ncbi:MAG: hypothetical protein ABEK50_16170, partial [bacterium]
MEPDDFYNKFKGRALDDKFDFIEEHLDNRDLFAGDYAIEIIEELYRLSPRDNKTNDFLNLLQSIRANRPDLKDNQSHVLLKFKLLTKLGNSEPLSDDEFDKLANHYPDYPDVLSPVWDACRFHCSLEQFRNLTKKALPKINRTENIMDNWKLEYIRQAHEAEIIWLWNSSDSQSIETLVDKHEEKFLFYMEDYHESEFPHEELIDWCRGVTGQKTVSQNQMPGYPQTCIPVQTFIHYLRKETDYPLTRASMVASELGNYFDNRTDTMERDTASQRTQSELNQTQSSPEENANSGEVWLPEADSLDKYLDKRTGMFNTRIFSVSPTLLSIPHWLDYAREYSLTNSDIPDQFMNQIQPTIEKFRDFHYKRYPDREIIDELEKL